MSTSASRAARQFSVQRSDDGIILVDRRDESRSVELRRALIHLTIEGSTLRVCRSLTPDGLERWLTLQIVQFSLGSDDDSSGISVWPEGEDDRYDAEDTVFGIDGQNLLTLEIVYARVINLDARDEQGHRYIGEHSDPDGEDLADGDGVEEGENHPALAQLWYHSYALVLDIGLSEPQFSDLLEACVSGRADTISLECSCYAYTTGWAFQSARDIVLSPGETVRLNVAEASASGLVPTARSVPALSVNEDDDKAQVAEWQQDRDNHARVPSGASAYVILVATLMICVFAAFLGAGSAIVVTIAVLGGTMALIGVLRSVEKAIVERLTSGLQ
jgi:hypothetical protein